MANIVPVDLVTFLDNISKDLLMPVLRESKAYIKSGLNNHIIKTRVFKGKTTLQVVECLYKIYTLCCNDDPKKVLGFSPSIELSVGILSESYIRDYTFTRDAIVNLIEKIGYFTIKQNNSKDLIISYNNNDIYIRPIKHTSDLISNTFIGIINTDIAWDGNKVSLAINAIQRTTARMAFSPYKFVLFIIPPDEINSRSYIKNVIDSLNPAFFTVIIDPTELSDGDISNYFC